MKKKQRQQERANKRQSNAALTTTTTTTPHFERVRGYELTFSPKVMAANSKSMREAIMEFTSAFHHKTNGEAIFYPTTKVYPKPAPITNIKANFPSTAAELEDFFQVNKIDNTHSF